MNWVNNFYTGSSLAGRAGHVRQQIEDGEFPSDIWIIAAALNGKDVFDIRKASDLGKSCYRKHPATIVGIAGSKAEAVSLVGQMADDLMVKTGKADLRSLLSDERKTVRS